MCIIGIVVYWVRHSSNSHLTKQTYVGNYCIFLNICSVAAPLFDIGKVTILIWKLNICFVFFLGCSKQIKRIVASSSLHCVFCGLLPVDVLWVHRWWYCYLGKQQKSFIIQFKTKTLGIMHCFITWFLQVPNVIATIISILQLSLFIIYPGSPKGVFPEKYEHI